MKATIEWFKDNFVEWLKSRRIPMLKKHLVFAGGFDSDLCKYVILTELEEEKRIIVNHYPDGLDTYEVAPPISKQKSRRATVNKQKLIVEI